MTSQISTSALNPPTIVHKSVAIYHLDSSVCVMMDTECRIQFVLVRNPK